MDLDNLEGDGLYNCLFDDPDKLLDENDRLRRLLYSTARKYNQTWRELEAIKIANGFYEKPFLFLHLPREIRDRIYLYSLRAYDTAEVRPRQNFMLAIEDYPLKPPTPGLLRTNKQIYREAVEILYSKNVIHFHLSQELSDFESRIGARNCNLVQEIKIVVMFPQATRREMGRELALTIEHNFLSVWTKALGKSRLRNVLRMTVEAEFLDPLEYPRPSIPDKLQKAVENLLWRNLRSQDHRIPPRLILQGFIEGEHEKFPESWNVISERWWEEELEGYDSSNGCLIDSTVL